MTTTADVHILGYDFSNFVRTLMLICEEHDISYTTGFSYQGGLIDYKSDAHLALHPFGKFPVLIENELKLTETASIGRYLQTKAKNAITFNTVDNAKHDAFCALASIYIDKAIIRDYLLEFAFPKGNDGKVRFEVADSMKKEVHTALDVIETTLAQEAFLNNEQLSLADALLAPMLHYLSTLPESYNLLLTHPDANAYLTQLMTRPSCQKLLVAKGAKI